MKTLNQPRYIVKVRIENFQSHEDTEFELSPGINLLVGSSDAGKSAVLRAINLAYHNQPRGNDFIRQGCDEARVHIWWNDGCYLCRIKGEHRNAVLIKDKDGFEEGYERIGATLPPEVLAVLGNPPIDEESGPIAYADQHQPLFLVTLSSSELPRTISRLTGIDDFEEAAELLNKKANTANRQIKDSTKRIENYNEQLKTYDSLDAQLNHMDKMEHLSEQIDEISDVVTNARNLKQNYDDLMEMGRVANTALKEATKISVLSTYLPEIQSTLKTLSAAQKLSKDYETLSIRENEAIKVLKECDIILGAKPQKITAKIDDILLTISQARDFKKLYDDLIELGKKLNKEYIKETETLATYQEEYNKAIVEMRDTGLWCNICQRPKSMDVCE
jgi:exonuclease SbcC